MASQKFPFLLPVGRKLWGSLYKPETTDFEGRPLVYKSGPDMGKPRVEFNFGVAIPKDGSGQHWASTSWGAPIWQAGHSGVANAGQIGDFSWKVIDGDSDVVPKAQPNKPAPKAPRDKAGFAGHWVLSLSSSFAPSIVDGTDGSFRPMTQEGAVMPGDLIQVQGSAAYNGSQGNPGVFLNHDIVCFSGYHKDGRLTTSVNAAAVGFQTGLAAGAVAAPPGTFPGAAVSAPSAPAAPAAPVPPAVPAAPPVTAPVPPVAVAPNPAFAPPPPVPVPAAPAAPVRTMLPAANGVPYEEWVKAGWTDAQLIQQGKMAA